MDGHYYSERERIAYWKNMFPSGKFWCGHCNNTHELMAHRESQKRKGKPLNQCSCGAALAWEAFDGEKASARAGGPGGGPDVPKRYKP